MSDTAAHSELAWDLVDRLHKSLRIGKCKPGEMKSILGVSPATMTNYLSGKTRPKDGMLRQWGMRCGVPFEWLRSGVDTEGGDDPGGLEVSHRRWNGDATIFTLPTRNLAAAA